MNDWRGSSTANDDDLNIDTIALLHGEIARLEVELRARDEDRAGDELTTDWHANRNFDDNEPLRIRLIELSNELAAKDETIGLLLEQARFYEDAAAVQRAEWDELQRWVEEVEHRLRTSDTGEGLDREQLDAALQRLEDLSNQSEADHKAWEVQRRGLEQEVNRLRALISRTPGHTTAGSEFAALEDENRMLRERCQALKLSPSDVPEIESLRKKMAETLARFDVSQVAHRRAGDQWSREKCELEAALSVARGQITREALLTPMVAIDTGNLAANSAAIEADERIRAFRQHLQELHHREAEERASRGGLSARIARLWKPHGSS